MVTPSQAPENIPSIAPPTDEVDRRVAALDGIRGLMTLMVVISHYFGELPHGISALCFGWVAVNMFFVLSGYLIGKLIIDKGESDNFFLVFYVRRFCRILPNYIIVLLITWFLIQHFKNTDWIDADIVFPLWSYITFFQNFFMVSTDSIGAHWLAPTWTLGIEEHFYLIVPSLILFTPRRYFKRVLLTLILSAVIMRLVSYQSDFFPPMSAFVLLPTRADILLCGVFAALLITTPSIQWQKWMLTVRLLPLVLLVATLLLRLIDSPAQTYFTIYSPLLVAIGSASFLLMLVLDAPEAQRFKSKALIFFGNTSYAVYLTHMQVLGLMHGLILGTKPDIATLEQLLVSIASFPVAILIGWVILRWIEEPMMAYGRTWRWSKTKLSRAYR